MIDYFDVILKIISIIVIGVIIPILANMKSTTEWREIYEKVVIAVNAVEQIYGGKLYGEDKKAKAYDYLQQLGIEKSDEEIDLMIEAAVKEMDKWKDALLKNE